MLAKPRAAGPRSRLLRAAPVIVSVLMVLSCRADPPLPPDPDEPTPGLACDEVPLTLTRIDADSTLERPPWLQVCTACPIAEADVLVGDGFGGALPTEALWSPGRECVLGMSAAPLPARPSVPASVDLVDPVGRLAEFEFDLALPEGRGANPVDLGSATWHLPLPDEAFRALGGRELLPGAPSGLLISLGVADQDARRALTFAPTRGDSPIQDTCEPTAQWDTPATLLSRQVATPLVSGDGLPGGLRADRGAFQGRLTDDGSALLDVTLLALVSLPESEPELGLSPSEACDALAIAVGFDPCVPCGPPSEGLAGLPACVPLLIEGARAERVDVPLVPIDPDFISPNCRQSPAID